MSLSTSAEASPLVALAVYCPLLCQDREERAQDNILFFFPPHSSPNRQMNQVGFCIAMSSLADRFGVYNSTRQTIRKQRSSVCLCSPVADLWASAHVRGGHSEAETTHQLLQLSFALFELLYGRTVLRRLTRKPSDADINDCSSEAAAGTSPSGSDLHSFAEAQAVLQSFFTKCAHFFAEVLTAQHEAASTASGGIAAAPLSFRPSPSMTSAQWARYLCAEVLLGFPLHHVNAHELPRRLLGNVEDVVQRALWQRTAPDGDSPRCCLFCLPSLYVLMADGRLSTAQLRVLKFYFVLYAPITGASFVCHLPDSEGLCDVAVWQEANVLVVLIERQSTTTTATAAAATPAASVPLLQYARTIGIEARQLLLRSAAGLTTPAERDAYWIASCDVGRHTAQYSTVPPPAPPAAVGGSLVLRLRFSGGVVEGTPLVHVWPALVERLRTLISVMKLTAAASPSADAEWESWARWGPLWIYLRVAGPATAVLVWRSPPTIRHIFSNAPRALLLQT